MVAQCSCTRSFSDGEQSEVYEQKSTGQHTCTEECVLGLITHIHDILSTSDQMCAHTTLKKL